MKALIAVVLAALTVAASAQEAIKIGSVSYDRIKVEADIAKRAQQRIQTEFSQREKDLNDQSVKLRADADKLERDAPTLSDSEKLRRQKVLVDTDRDLQRKQRAFQEDLAQRKNEELANIQERASRAIKQVIDAEHYDLILDTQSVSYASPRMDITDKVIKLMNGQK